MQEMEDNLIRPKRVTIALTLLYISFGIWNIGYIQIIKSYPSKSFQLHLGSLIITSAIILFLIYMIGKGRDWARMSYFWIFAIFAPHSVPEVWKSTSIDYIIKIHYLSQLVLIIFAFILSFYKESNIWFTKVSMLTRQSGGHEAIPRSVKIAITLLYILIGIHIYGQAVSILGYILDVTKLNLGFHPKSSLGRYVSNHVVVLILLVIVKDALWVCLVYLIGKRKNWARIIILVTFIIDILRFFWIFPESVVTNPISLISNLPLYIASVVALVYLFLRKSNEWFKQSGQLVVQPSYRDDVI
jgi:hypothetical protein